MIMSNKGKAMFIVVEGADQTGKTTFTKQLQRVMVDMGINCFLTGVPGGTESGSKVRELLMSLPLDDDERLSLFLTDRLITAREVIKPCINNGVNVICSRWTWSSMVYQGREEFCRVLDEEFEVPEPDLYILLETTDTIAKYQYDLKKDPDSMDTEYLGNRGYYVDRYRELFESYEGNALRLKYNTGTTPPTDQEFKDEYGYVMGRITEIMVDNNYPHIH